MTTPKLATINVAAIFNTEGFGSAALREKIARQLEDQQAPSAKSASPHLMATVELTNDGDDLSKVPSAANSSGEFKFQTPLDRELPKPRIAGNDFNFGFASVTRKVDDAVDTGAPSDHSRATISLPPDLRDALSQPDPALRRAQFESLIASLEPLKRRFPSFFLSDFNHHDFDTTPYHRPDHATGAKDLSSLTNMTELRQRIVQKMTELAKQDQKVPGTEASADAEAQLQFKRPAPRVEEIFASLSSNVGGPAANPALSAHLKPGFVGPNIKVNEAGTTSGFSDHRPTISVWHSETFDYDKRLYQPDVAAEAPAATDKKTPDGE